MSRTVHENSRQDQKSGKKRKESHPQFSGKQKKRIFRNNNREVIRELAMDNYNAHKTRNFMAVLAIVLTTILITAVLTVGFSWTSTIVNYGESAPGPGCQGSIHITKDKAEKVKELPQAEWADYIQKCTDTPLRNKEFTGMTVWLMSPEQSYYQHNFINLLDGHYPEKGTEVLISDTMVKRLGYENPVGQKLSLSMLLGEEENQKEINLPFTICGYFKNPLIAIENIYDEIYTTEDFMKVHNPAQLEKPGDVYVNLNNLNPFLLKSDVPDKLSEINDLVGGAGFGTKNTNTLTNQVLGIFPALLLVLLIICSGYFLIYNVFYISVAADIRWFGMMKTIGTTPGQLKEILMVQIKRLALIGIVIGVIFGYLIGNKLGPGIMANTIYGQFYEAQNMLLVFLIGACFSWMTVYLSARKSLKMAAAISPVEAARYTPKRKKNLFTVLSLALSGIVFMVACNAALGYSVPHMVDRYNQEDVQIFHKAEHWDIGGEKYQPLDFGLVEQLKKLPYVSKVDVIYMARTQPDYVDYAEGRVYDTSRAQIKPEGKLKKWMDTIKETTGFYYTNQPDDESGDVRLKVMGLPVDRLKKNEAYMNLLDGVFDEEKFASGDYIIWRDPWEAQDMEQSIVEKNRLRTGDEITLNLYNDVTKTYYKKKVTILATVKDGDMYGTSDFTISNIIMPDTLFCQVYPDWKDRIASIQIKTSHELGKTESEEINRLVADTHSTQLQITSRYQTRVEQKDSKCTMELIGLFLASLLGIIGVSNVINTITSDVFARKLELAALQSIGMTKKQLFRMLFADSMKFSGAALLIILPAGGILSKLITENPIFTGFSMSWFFISGIGMVLIVIGVDLLVTAILVKELNKKSIVERLREIE